MGEDSAKKLADVVELHPTDEKFERLLRLQQQWVLAKLAGQKVEVMDGMAEKVEWMVERSLSQQRYVHRHVSQPTPSQPVATGDLVEVAVQWAVAARERDFNGFIAKLGLLRARLDRIRKASQDSVWQKYTASLLFDALLLSRIDLDRSTEPVLEGVRQISSGESGRDQFAKLRISLVLAGYSLGNPDDHGG